MRKNFINQNREKQWEYGQNFVTGSRAKQNKTLAGR
jgi:hypothetical protein